MRKQDMLNALDYFELWVENDLGLDDDLARHRKVAYECIKECLNYHKSQCPRNKRRKNKKGNGSEK